MKKYRGATWCNSCEKDPEETIRCKYCATNFNIRPRVYTKLGFSKPTKCKECRILKTATCTQCPNKEEIPNSLYLKKTKN